VSADRRLFSVPEAKLDRLATAYQTDFATGKTALFDEARGVWDSPVPPAVNRDFWTTAYQAIDD